MSLQSGDLRASVEWFTYSARTIPGPGGSMGQRVPTPTSRGVHRAKVEPLGGAQLYNATMIRAARYFKVTMRVVGNVQPGDYLVFRGRRLNVTSAYTLLEKGYWLILHATEDDTPGPGGIPA